METYNAGESRRVSELWNGNEGKGMWVCKGEVPNVRHDAINLFRLTPMDCPICDEEFDCHTQGITYYKCGAKRYYRDGWKTDCKKEKK